MITFSTTGTGRRRPGKWHGFRHAQRALDNAQRDFHLNAVERDVIRKHMFPLNLRPPRYRESVLVSCADKLCALGEMVELSALRRRVRRWRRASSWGDAGLPL